VVVLLTYFFIIECIQKLSTKEEVWSWCCFLYRNTTKSFIKFFAVISW